MSLAYLAWITICLVWGTTYLAIRVCLETVPPGLGAGLRWTLAGFLLVVGHLAARRPLPRLTAWPRLALLGILFIVSGNGLVVWAEQWVPSGLTCVLLATTPFWMVGLELFVRNGERPPTRTWIGLIVGFAGIGVLVWPDLTAGGSGGRGFLAGVLALQAACLTWSIGSAYSRSRKPGERDATLGAAAVEMIFGGVILTVIGSIAGEWPRLAFSARSAFAFAYLVAVGSIVAYSAYLYTLKHLPVSTISLYSYINPIIAVVLGTLLLGEAFSLRSALASAVVLLAVALVQTGARRPAAEAGEPDGGDVGGCRAEAEA